MTKQTTIVVTGALRVVIIFCAAISEHTLVNEPCHEKTTLVTREQNQTSHHIPIITSDNVLHHLE